ncbi:LuxR C-terminal-related transcriptional regulator [Streptomyces sp. NPDC016562]
MADHLRVSPRTAEHHVANALRKLGISSRTQLAAALATTDEKPSTPE